MTDPIKAKIIELCPDIMELKFGCQVRDSDGVATLMREYKKCGDGIYEGKNERGFTVVTHFDEILGRPITLADVLRAIRFGKPSALTNVHVEIDGSICARKSGEENFSVMAFWNLLKDYDGETEETRRFIGSLLGV